MGIFDKDRDLLATTKTILETARNFAVVTALGYAAKTSEIRVLQYGYFFVLYTFVMNLQLNIPMPGSVFQYMWGLKVPLRYMAFCVFLIITCIPIWYLNNKIFDLADQIIVYQQQQKYPAPKVVPSCKFSLDLTGHTCLAEPSH